VVRVRVRDRVTVTVAVTVTVWVWFRAIERLASMSSFALVMTLVKSTFVSRCCASILLAFISAW
jgi:hypothetical protein